MKPVTKNALVLLLALMFSPMVMAEGIKFDHLSLDEALSKAKKENKIIFIDVYATWCGPCKYLSNSVFTDDDLGAYMNENFISVKIDGEKEDGIALAMDFEVDAYPTMMFVSPENKLLKKIVGAVEADRILSTAQGVVDPESTEIYKLQAAYDAGSRDQELMFDLITETLDLGEDAVPIALEYVEHFPDLDLEKEDDFLIFYLTSDDLDNPHVIEFINNPQKYSDLHSGLAQRKIDAMIGRIVEESVKNDRREDISSGINTVYEAYAIVNSDEAYEKENLIFLLEEYFDKQKVED